MTKVNIAPDLFVSISISLTMSENNWTYSRPNINTSLEITIPESMLYTPRLADLIAKKIEALKVSFPAAKAEYEAAEAAKAAQEAADRAAEEAENITFTPAV